MQHCRHTSYPDTPFETDVRTIGLLQVRCGAEHRLSCLSIIPKSSGHKQAADLAFKNGNYPEAASNYTKFQIRESLIWQQLT